MSDDIGLFIWDENGNLVIKPSTAITKILGFLDTGNTPGSLVVPGFAGGAPFAAIQRCEIYYRAPRLVISGTTLSWSWQFYNTAAGRRTARVLYGIRM